MIVVVLKVGLNIDSITAWPPASSSPSSVRTYPLTTKSTHNYCKQVQNSLVLNAILSLEKSLIDRQTSKGSGFTLCDHHCELELSHEVAWFLSKDGEGDEQLMLETLLDTNTGNNGVFEGVEGETERGVAVHHIVEELPTLLDLEVVGTVHGTLVDSATQISLLWLTLPTADKHVQCEDVVHGELLGIDSLFEGLLIDDDLIAVDEVLLELVGEDSLEGSHLVGIAHLLDHLSDLVVEVSWLHQSQSSLSRLVSSQDDVCLLSSDGGILV